MGWCGVGWVGVGWGRDDDLPCTCNILYIHYMILYVSVIIEWSH